MADFVQSSRFTRTLSRRPEEFSRAASSTGDVAGITLLRFLVMLFVLELAGAAGVEGWYLGLVTNLAVTILASVLMTRRGLWRASGATTAWRSWGALVAVAVLGQETKINGWRG